MPPKWQRQGEVQSVLAEWTTAHSCHCWGELQRWIKVEPTSGNLSSSLKGERGIFSNASQDRKLLWLSPFNTITRTADSEVRLEERYTTKFILRRTYHYKLLETIFYFLSSSKVQWKNIHTMITLMDCLKGKGFYFLRHINISNITNTLKKPQRRGV